MAVKQPRIKEASEYSYADRKEQIKRFNLETIKGKWNDRSLCESKINYNQEQWQNKPP